jgi:NAD/NADP transhydrogenase alpha subunit
MAMHASQMFARNVQTLVDLLRKDGKLVLDLQDDIVKAMLQSPPEGRNP